MKTIYKLIFAALIILIVGGLLFGYFDLKTKLEISHENTNQLIDETRQNKELFLTRDQLGSYISNSNNKLLKHILDSLNIKTKHVIRTVNNNYYNHYKDTVIKAEQKDSIYSTLYAPDKCFQVGVEFNLASKHFLFKDPIMNYSSQSVLYKSRENKKGKKRFWPFGKNYTRTETLNNCTGKTTTEEVTVIKR